MSQKTIFKIKLTNWAKHNTAHKKSYKRVMLSNNFITDAKIRALTATERWVFLNLIVTCSDHCRDTVEVSSKHLREMLECNRNIDGVLGRMQELQLLTFEKTPLIELNRKNRTERNEKKTDEVQPKPKPAAVQAELIEKPKSDPVANSKVWEAYRQSYSQRYGVEPIRNATTNTQISNLVKKLGEGEAMLVVKFYLTHNDSFYVKNTHTLGHCLHAAETLRTQMLKGKPITSTMIRGMEKQQVFRNSLDDMENIK